MVNYIIIYFFNNYYYLLYHNPLNKSLITIPQRALSTLDEQDPYLGLLYFQEKNYDKAIEQWNKILEIEPDFSNKYVVLHNLGMVYEKKKILDKALEYFLKALQLAPEGSPIIEEIEEEIYNIYKNKLEN